MKRMSAMLLVMLFLLLVGCSAVGTETDYPAAIMAEGTVYLKSVSAMPAEIDESAIIGYTTFLYRHLSGKGWRDQFQPRTEYALCQSGGRHRSPL